MPHRIARFIGILNSIRLVFEPLKKVTIEVFWYLLVVREILRYLKFR